MTIIMFGYIGLNILNHEISVLMIFFHECNLNMSSAARFVEISSSILSDAIWIPTKSFITKETSTGMC